MTEREQFLLNKWCNVLYRVARIMEWRLKRHERGGILQDSNPLFSHETYSKNA